MVFKKSAAGCKSGEITVYTHTNNKHRKAYRDFVVVFLFVFFFKTEGAEVRLYCTKQLGGKNTNRLYFGMVARYKERRKMQNLFLLMEEFYGTCIF